jgi:hypothetical protein
MRLIISKYLYYKHMQDYVTDDSGDLAFEG